MEERFAWKPGRLAMGLIVLSSLLLFVSTVLLDTSTIASRIAGLLGLALIGLEVLGERHYGQTIRIDARGLSLLSSSLSGGERDSKTAWSVAWQEPADWLISTDAITAVPRDGKIRRITRQRFLGGEWQNFDRLREIVAEHRNGSES